MRSNLRISPRKRFRRCSSQPESMRVLLFPLTGVASAGPLRSSFRARRADSPSRPELSRFRTEPTFSFISEERRSVPAPEKTTTGGHVTVCRQAVAVAVGSFRENRQSSHTVHAREGGEERIAADHCGFAMVRRTGRGTRPFFGHLETDKITVTRGLGCC